jgi:hypothetical protein
LLGFPLEPIINMPPFREASFKANSIRFSGTNPAYQRVQGTRRIIADLDFAVNVCESQMNASEYFLIGK